MVDEAGVRTRLPLISLYIIFLAESLTNVQYGSMENFWEHTKVCSEGPIFQ